MNLANKITLSRIFLTFVFMTFLFSKGLVFKVLALFVFVIATFTDFLDGFIAKRRNQITDFGKFMDPIADKVLLVSAFLAFVELKLIPAWIVLIIVFREFIITGLRLFYLAKGEIIEASLAGKHKTVSQMVSIYMILFSIIFKEAGSKTFSFWNEGTEYIFREVIYYMMLVTAALTVISGASYIRRSKKFFMNEKNN